MAHIADSSDRAKAILDAIAKQRDVFEASVQLHRLETIKLHEEGMKQVKEQHLTTRAEINKESQGTSMVIQVEHIKTREEIHVQAAIVEDLLIATEDRTKERITSAETGIVELISYADQANQAEHARTQDQVAELQRALYQLGEQIKTRDCELKALLDAYHRTKNSKKRKDLVERSNAVTAALLALETMYKGLQVRIVSGTS